MKKKQLTNIEKEVLFTEALIRAHQNGWKELDLQGFKKIKSISSKIKDLYWTKWGVELFVEVSGTTINFNVSYNDILLSPYFAKAFMSPDQIAYKLAGSYVYEWEIYLHDMAETNPEDRFEILKAYLQPKEESEE